MSVSAVSGQPVSQVDVSISIQIQVVQVDVNPPPTISQGASLLSQLQDLEKSDPAKFKAVMSQVSGELRAEAQQSGGSKAALLNELADRFAAAAQAGDVSALSASPSSPTGSGAPSLASGSSSASASDASSSAPVHSGHRHHHGFRAHQRYGGRSSSAGWVANGVLEHVAELVADALASAESAPASGLSGSPASLSSSSAVAPAATPAS